MAISRVTRFSVEGSNSSVPIPSGVQAGDLLVLFVKGSGNGFDYSITLNGTAAGKFTNLIAPDQQPNGGFSYTRGVWVSTTAVAGDTIGATPAGGTASFECVVYRGQAGYAEVVMHEPVLDDTASSGGVAGGVSRTTALTYPGFTSDDRNSVHLHVGFGIATTDDPNTINYGVPSGYTEVRDQRGWLTSERAYADPVTVGTLSGSLTWMRNNSSSDSTAVSILSMEIVAKNLAPGAPGAFTKPTSGQIISTTADVAWGAASDPDGDPLVYDVELSRDGGASWLRIRTGGAGTTFTHDFTGTATKQALLRVRAVDPDGLASGWVNSPAFTINRNPGAPTVTAPNGGELYNTLHAISWNAGSDPDGQALTYDVDLTTDGGSTWSNLKTAFSGTSFTHDFTNVAASTACRVRVRSRDPFDALSAYDESNANFTIQHNQAPTAPILGKPENGITADLAAGYTFTYTATDPDSGDAPSAWAFRRKVAGAASYEYWNAGTAAWQSTIAWNTNPTGSVAFASGKWTNGNTYNWSVATKDTQGLEGPFAADFSVTASSVATTTVTAPSGSVTTTSRPLVEWTLTQPEGAPQQTYQVKVFSAAQYGATGFDPATSAATWETVEIASAGAREHQVGVDLVNGTTYRAYVRLKSADLYTAWASSEFAMALTPPPPVTLAVTDEPTSPFGPRVRLDVDLAFDATFTQANTTIRVERSDDGGATWATVRNADRLPLTVDGSAVALDYEPPRGVPVQYRALSVGDV